MLETIKSIGSVILFLLVCSVFIFVFCHDEYDNLKVYGSDNNQISFLNNNNIAASVNGKFIHAKSSSHLEPGCYKVTGYNQPETGDYMVVSFKLNKSASMCD
jgi:hypothetical protein